MTDATPPAARPEPRLDMRHAVSLCVGMVVGAGIFKTSPMVAQALVDPTQLYLAWAFGGLLSLIGALCFAELAATFPDAGGDYRFLRRAYGHRLGFLFAWSRFAVIHTGSMALLGFVFGDYLGQVLDLRPWLGTHASATLAAALIVALTGLNLLGVRVGLGTQLGLMLSGGALIVLRHREPDRPRPFRVPLYPLLPLLFSACSAYVLWSSLVYVKAGAIVGLAVLAAGGLLLAVLHRRAPAAQPG